MDSQYLVLVAVVCGVTGVADNGVFHLFPANGSITMRCADTASIPQSGSKMHCRLSEANVYINGNLADPAPTVLFVPELKFATQQEVPEVPSHPHCSKSGWGSKWTVMLIPIVVFFICVLMYVCYRAVRFKHKWELANATNDYERQHPQPSGEDSSSRGDDDDAVSSAVVGVGSVPHGRGRKGSFTLSMQQATFTGMASSITLYETRYNYPPMEEADCGPPTPIPTDNSHTDHAISNMHSNMSTPVVSKTSTGTGGASSSQASGTMTTDSHTTTSSIGGLRPPEILASERNLAHQRAKATALRNQIQQVNSNIEGLEQQCRRVQLSLDAINNEVEQLQQEYGRWEQAAKRRKKQPPKATEPDHKRTKQPSGTFTRGSL